MTWTFCSHSLAPHCLCVREAWVLTMVSFIFIFVFEIGFSVKWAAFVGSSLRHANANLLFKNGKNVSSTSQVCFTSHTLRVGKVSEDEWHSFCPLLFVSLKNEIKIISIHRWSHPIQFFSFRSFVPIVLLLWHLRRYDNWNEIGSLRYKISIRSVRRQKMRMNNILRFDGSSCYYSAPCISTFINPIVVCVCVAVASLFPTSKNGIEWNRSSSIFISDFGFRNCLIPNQLAYQNGRDGETVRKREEREKYCFRCRTILPLLCVCCYFHPFFCCTVSFHRIREKNLIDAQHLSVSVGLSSLLILFLHLLRRISSIGKMLCIYLFNIKSHAHHQQQKNGKISNSFTIE